MNREQMSQIEEKLTEARFKFAINCLHNVMQIKPKKNFAFSPYCIYEGLTMIYLTFHGNIEKQLKDILYLKNVFKFDLRYYIFGLNNQQRVMQRFNNQNESQNGSAVLPVYDDYINLWCDSLHICTSRYPGCYDIFDYFNYIDNICPIRTMNKINIIIKDKLKDHMIHPVKLSVIRKNMEFILMIALRFNDQRFQISTACQSDAPSVSTIPDKRKRREFFCEELRMHMSEFPYENGNTSLFIMLPASTDSGYCKIKEDATDTDISNMIKQLSTEDGMCKLRDLLDHDATSKEDTNFSKWPTFRVERNLKIRELLLALGLEELISFGVIHKIKQCPLFSPFLMHLGNAVHRAYINVTEENTVASATTLIYTGQESSPSITQVDVNCNYPFVWLIYDKSRRNILFVGAFNKFAESGPPP